MNFGDLIQKEFSKDFSVISTEVLTGILKEENIHQLAALYKVAVATSTSENATKDQKQKFLTICSVIRIRIEELKTYPLFGSFADKFTELIGL